MTDPRSNSLLVRAPNASRLASIRALVDKLDRPSQGSSAAGNVWVVYLKNADAVKLATVLRAAYGGGLQQSSIGLFPLLLGTQIAADRVARALLPSLSKSDKRERAE